MAEAYRKAIEFVLTKINAGIDHFQIQLDFPEFKQGQFRINRVYGFDPPLIGMYSPKVPLIKLDKHSLSKILDFAKRHRYKFKVSGVDIFLEEKSRRVAWLRENFFGATFPELFEAIGTEIYNLKTDQPQDTTFKLDLLPISSQNDKKQ